MACDYVLMAVAPNLWWLALGRIIAGITSSSFTTAFAYMADITPPENRARGYGLIGAAFSAGFVAGPLLGGVLGEILAARAVLGGRGDEHAGLLLRLADPAGIAGAGKPHGVLLEARQSVRRHAAAALASRAHRPGGRELPALFRAPRLLRRLRALCRLSLWLDAMAGRRTAGRWSACST